MALLTYEGIFFRPESVAWVRAARPAIERIGGRVEIAPPTADGMVLITLFLPSSCHPRDFFGDLPFTRV